MDYIWFQENAFYVFIVGFLFFINIHNPKALFFLLALLLIFLLFYFKAVTKRTKKEGNITSFVSGMKDLLSKDYEIPNDTIYYIHKTPRDLKYLAQADDIKKIMYDLSFLNIYDTPSFERVISYTEYFLKIHYKIMTGKYDFGTYFPLLRDTRNELLNTMKAIYFTLPKISKIMHIDDLDLYLEDKIVLMQAKTNRYMKVLIHKQGVQASRYGPPYENDGMKDRYYNLF